jgi:hypothetical protein
MEVGNKTVEADELWHMDGVALFFKIETLPIPNRTLLHTAPLDKVIIIIYDLR